MSDGEWTKMGRREPTREPVPMDRRLGCPILIGRSAQLAVLIRLAAQATEGRGQVVLLSGDAGVGKSRLLTEPIAACAAPGAEAADPMMRVLKGRCFEEDRALPYAPILDLLRGYFATCVPGEFAASLGVSASAIGTLLPELVHLLPEAAGPAAEPPQEKRRLYDAMVQIFASLAARQPVLAIVEDVHWSDDASLELLLYLVRRIASFPVLLALTFRPDEIPTALARLLAELERERLATEIALQPLHRGEVEAMIRTIFNQRQPIGSGFLDAIYALTEGNPFFVEEIVASLIASGDIFYVDGRWDRKPLDELRIPRAVQVAVQRRMERLGAEARRLLAVAAVAGRRFDITVLQLVTDQDEATLVGVIRELIDAQLVVEESADVFAFRHALTRQAVYARLLAQERRGCMRRSR